MYKARENAKLRKGNIKEKDFLLLTFVTAAEFSTQENYTQMFHLLHFHNNILI